MGDVVKVVNNVTKEVSKGVNNVVKETSKAVSTTGQIVGNAGNLVGGDVGKVINAVTAPTGAIIQSGGDVLKGDLKGAVARQTGAFLAAGTMPLNASSSLQDVARHETINNLTMGFSNDIAEVNDASKRMIYKGEISDQDLSAMGRLGVRTALAVGTVGAVNAAGGLSSVGSTAVNAGKSGWGFLQAAAPVAAGVQAFAKDPVKGVASYLGFDKELEEIREITDRPSPVSPAPAINRAPSSTAGAAISSSTFSTIMPYLAVGGAALLALILILKRK